MDPQEPKKLLVELLKRASDRKKIIREKSLEALCKRLLKAVYLSHDDIYLRILLHTVGLKRLDFFTLAGVTYKMSTMAKGNVVDDKHLMDFLIRPIMYRHRDLLLSSFFSASGKREFYRRLISILTTGTMKLAVHKLAEVTSHIESVHGIFDSIAKSERLWKGISHLTYVGTTLPKSKMAGELFDEWAPHGIMGSTIGGLFGWYGLQKVLEVALPRTLDLAKTVVTSVKSQFSPNSEDASSATTTNRNVVIEGKTSGGGSGACRTDRATLERPKEVIIDIKRRLCSTKFYYTVQGSATEIKVSKNGAQNTSTYPPSGGICIKPTNIELSKEFTDKVPVDYVEYVHELPDDNPRRGFTLKVVSGGVVIEDINLPMEAVASVSVFYWSDLEDTTLRDTNRPLLIKVRLRDVGEKWYENDGTSGGDLNWTQVKDGYGLEEECKLKKKLDDTNCKLNKVDIKHILQSLPKHSGEQLESIENKCQSKEVTIDIKERPENGKNYYTPNVGHHVEIKLSKNEDPSSKVPFGYVEYVHELPGYYRRTYFTLNQVNCGNEKATDFGTLPTQKVSSVSVFYWAALETKPELEKKGRPLLLKLTYHGGSTRWYENFGNTTTNPNTIWVYLCKDLVAEDKLKSILDEANCRLNKAVIIDVSEKPEDDHGTKYYDRCNELPHARLLDPGYGQRMKVEKAAKPIIGMYAVYDHILKANHGDKFHIVGFVNGKTGSIDLTKIPILDVSSVKLYMCGSVPLLLYIESSTFEYGKKWFKESGIWTPVIQPTLNTSSYDDILNILDELNSGCAPPSVAIDISVKTNGNDFSQYDSVNSSNEEITVIRDVGRGSQNHPQSYEIYKHTVMNRIGSYFTLENLVHKKGNAIKIGGYEFSKIDAVTSVSVYYWSHLSVGRPLLVKVESRQQKSNPVSKSYKWYENAGDPGDKNWIPVTEPTNPAELAGTTLRNKLDLLNCRLNKAVIIDVNKKPGQEDGTKEYGKCERKGIQDMDSKHNQRMQVKKDSSENEELNYYIVYTHSLESTSLSGKIFHVLSFKNSDHVITFPGVGTSPIINVDKVKIYFCESNPNTPLLIYYEQHHASSGKGATTHHWYKNYSGETPGNWKLVTSPDKVPSCTADYNGILAVLDTIESSCAPPSVTIDISKGVNRRSYRYTDSGDHSKKRKIDVQRETQAIDGSYPPENYDRYDHTVTTSPRTYFTLKSLVHKKGNDIKICGGKFTRTYAVTSLSVYYLSELESKPGSKGRPILVKVTKHDSSRPDYYENTYEDGDKKWNHVSEDLSTSGELQKRLNSLNCKLNGPVEIDIAETTEGAHPKYYGKCKNGRIELKNTHGDQLRDYKVYEHLHRLRSTFTISGFAKDGKSITLKGLEKKLPILDATGVTVYTCSNEPLLIYIPQAGKNKWFKKPAVGDKWEKVVNPPDPTSHPQILELLDSFGTSCGPKKVIVNIKERPENGAQNTSTYLSDGIDIKLSKNDGLSGKVPSGYVEYVHELPNGRKDFTLKGAQYDKVPIEGIVSHKNVTSVSVFYWSGLETKPDCQKGRPLLLKLTYHGGSTRWYENLGNNPTNPNTIWAYLCKDLVTDSEASGLPKLITKLHEVNCLLNNLSLEDILNPPISLPKPEDEKAAKSEVPHHRPGPPGPDSKEPPPDSYGAQSHKSGPNGQNGVQREEVPAADRSDQVPGTESEASTLHGTTVSGNENATSVPTASAISAKPATSGQGAGNSGNDSIGQGLLAWIGGTSLSGLLAAGIYAMWRFNRGVLWKKL